MQRQLVVLAIAAGCGNVQPPPDAPPDIDLMQGCVLKAAMDEASWAAPGSAVNACGTGAGSVTGTGATTIVDATRGRVGSFSNDACLEFASTDALHGTTGLTLSAWIRPTALNGEDSNGVISKRADKAVEAEYSLFVWT